MDMTERDYKILVKISKKQKELETTVNEYKIKTHIDFNKLPSVVRRGVVAFIADIFELTKPLTDSTKELLPFNLTIMKEFRNASTHNYDIVTNSLAYACLSHCVDKALVSAIDNQLNRK